MAPGSPAAIGVSSTIAPTTDVPGHSTDREASVATQPGRAAPSEMRADAAAAVEAARLAKAAADATGRWAAQVSENQRAGATAVAEAAKDSARIAVDAARAASDAVTDTGGPVESTSTRPDDEAGAQQPSERVGAALTRAKEAAAEASDRPRPIASLERSVETGYGLPLTRGQAFFLEAKKLSESGRHREARARLEDAVALDGGHDEARALLGWTEYVLADYPAAIVSFKTVLRRQPTWEGLYDGLGWSRLRLGRLLLAADAFRAALDLAPDNVDAQIGLGTAYFEAGLYASALPPLARARDRLAQLPGPESEELTQVRARIAWSLYYLRRYGEAAEAFKTALEAKPSWPGLHNGLGWSQVRLGQKADARRTFERALTIRPDDRDAAEGLQTTN